MKPVKRIVNEGQLKQFHGSECYAKLVDFILQLNEAVKGKTFPYQTDDAGCLAARQLLDTLQTWLALCPPETSNRGRFGNPAFRTWLTRLANTKIETEIELYAGLSEGEAGECHEYLLHAFGDYQRLDYGTGHELNLVCWLYCLWRLGRLRDLTGVVLVIFQRYALASNCLGTWR